MKNCEKEFSSNNRDNNRLSIFYIVGNTIYIFIIFYIVQFQVKMGQVKVGGDKILHLLYFPQKHNCSLFVAIVMYCLKTIKHTGET